MPSTTQDQSAPRRIAIVGSGPSGCYLAQSLLRGSPGVEVTIFDRLASPYGLIRYGVAADHQHTKAITRQFERLFTAPGVRFAGGVNVHGDVQAEPQPGVDVALSDIRAHYDAVVLATGLSHDRALGVPGDHLPGVFGAGAITRTLNAHPGERPELPSFGTDVVLVGGGNVALDVLRFLVKDRTGYAESDVADHALDHYLDQPAQRVSVLIRSSVSEMKGEAQMIRELEALPRARYRLAAPLPEAVTASEGTPADRAAAARLEAIAALTAESRAAHPGPEVTLHFDTTPLAILGSDRAESVSIVSANGPGAISVRASSVISAIGFVRDAAGPLARQLDEDSETGRIEPGLYRTGWAKRGPRGAIPENRTCAKNVADEILSDLTAGLIAPDPARRGFAGLGSQLQHESVSYAQWIRLDEHERESAPAGRTRRKLPDRDHMRAIAHGDAARTTEHSMKGTAL
ncbi:MULTISPECIES: FAD-dependent oxidoreductase [unclassified Leucobacter]|uniref:FAD-dependent oxidoreductase n=1 Tax=unclassified Leucobacter TaxID=2621730 RepID=UPI00165D98D4|nr:MULTISPECIES: FAD-dependent oxidoreductase [unclassified Leucobacter]MBC9937249.1 FAD-dependent oxidoreductase [Leucobacter sp. cx-87]